MEENKLFLYSITDEYISYLRKDAKLSKVYDNKENTRTHTRKYIGIVIKKNDLNYFIPLSSPKQSDYKTEENGEKSIRKNIIPIIRITSKNRIGDIELLGTLRLSNMIPVPKDALVLYEKEKDKDLKYTNVIEKDYKFIKKNRKLIENNASILYNQKTKEYVNNQSPPKYLEHVIDFIYAEKKCKEYESVIVQETEKEIKGIIKKPKCR